MKTRGPHIWTLAAWLLVTAAASVRAAALPLGIQGDEKLDVLWPFQQVGRTGHAMVYDTARQRLVVFGGTQRFETDGVEHYIFPTLEFADGAWRGIPADPFPPVETGHAMAYDAARGKTVLFGGGDLCSPDTWTYDGSAWVMRAPETRPSGRKDHSMAYDSVHGRVILFGGNATFDSDDHGAGLRNDLWEWDGTNWQQRAFSGGPPPRRGAAMVYAPDRGELIVHGGTYWVYTNSFFTPTVFSWQEKSLSDTWEWDGTTWTQKSTAGPSGTCAAAYDEQRHLAVMFQGGTTVYEWDGTSWASRTAAANLPVGAMAYDSQKQHVVLYATKFYSGSSYQIGTYEWTGAKWLFGGGFTPVIDVQRPVLLCEDVNGDALPDVFAVGQLPGAATNTYAWAVALFLRNGTALDPVPVWTASFGTDRSSSQNERPQCAALGDVNGDGRKDLALGFYNQKLRVFRNLGSTFTAAAIWTSTDSMLARDLTWVDVDNDGDPDLSALRSSPNAVVVYRNNGGTLTAAPVTTTTLPNSSDGQTAAMNTGYSAWGDIDRDGDPDLVMAYFYSASVDPPGIRVFANHGGTFTLKQTLSGHYGATALGDLDGDRYPDLVVDACVYSNRAGVFSSTPDATINKLDNSNVPDIALADVDGDGDPDLLVSYFVSTGWTDHKYAIYRNDCGLLQPDPAWMSEASLVTTVAQATDYDGDGDRDIVQWNGVCRLAPVFRATPRRPTAPRFVWAHSGVPANTDLSLSWERVNDPDIAGYRIFRTEWNSSSQTYNRLVAEVPQPQTNWVASNVSPGIYGYYVASVDRAGRESFLAGQAGCCSRAPTNSVNDGAPDVPNQPSILGVLDLDGDGDNDVFAETVHGHPTDTKRQWVVRQNVGGGNFLESWVWRQDDDPGTLYGPGHGTPVTFGDVDLDGRPDLVTLVSRAYPPPDGAESRMALEVYHNTGGGFAHTPFCRSWLPSGATPHYGDYLPPDKRPQDYAWGDVDGDGDLDLAVAGAGSVTGQEAILYLNDHGILSASNVWTSAQQIVHAVAFGDLDHDGKADLALCRRVGDYKGYLATYVYVGRTNGLAATPFWFHIVSTAKSTPYRLSWADFDGDGYQDLTAHGYNADTGDHMTFLYRNNSGVGLSGTPIASYNTKGYGETAWWADMDMDGDLDLVGSQCILMADAVRSPDAGPIGPPVDSWFKSTQFLDSRWFLYSYGVGSYSFMPMIEFVADLNGDHAPDLVTYSSYFGAGSSADIYFRKPHSLLQVLPPYPSQGVMQSLTLQPESLVTLAGPGATQSFTVLANYTNGTVDVTPLAKFTLDGADGTPDRPIAAMRANVLTALNDGLTHVTASFSNKTDSTTARVMSMPRPAESLAVTPSFVTLTRPWESVGLTVTRHTASGDVIDVTPVSVLTSSDPSVAAPSGATAVALNAGTALIQACWGGLCATTTVRVALTAAMDGLSLHPDPAAVWVGGQQALEARAHFADGTTLPVTFQTSFTALDSGIADMVGDQIHGVAAGDANVLASYGDATTLGRVFVDDATSLRMDILGASASAGLPRLEWYCTTPARATNAFTVYRATNLLEDKWVPVTSNLFRRPDGFNEWIAPAPSNGPVFYRIGVRH